MFSEELESVYATKHTKRRRERTVHSAQANEHTTTSNEAVGTLYNAPSFALEEL
jgi:hypothetical protein